MCRPKSLAMGHTQSPRVAMVGNHSCESTERKKLMGNDGSGWSMSVWPKNTTQEGQDKQPKKIRSPRVKDDGTRLTNTGAFAAPNPESELIKAGDPRHGSLEIQPKA